MAEAICRELIAKRLDCKIDQVEDKGVLVMSAGIAAMLGSRATHEAVQTMDQMNLDINNHETQPLTESLVRHADLIFTMTQSHREAILAQWPSASNRTRLLTADGSDISDPIGGPLERYEHCAVEIRRALSVLVQNLEL
jgi:protein-tyrosine-phosphatase